MIRFDIAVCESFTNSSTKGGLATHHKSGPVFEKTVGSKNTLKDMLTDVSVDSTKWVI